MSRLLRASILIVLSVAGLACGQEDAVDDSAPVMEARLPVNTQPPVADPEPLVYAGEAGAISDEVELSYLVKNEAINNCLDWSVCTEYSSIDACGMSRDMHSIAIVIVDTVTQELSACESPFRSLATVLEVETLTVLGGSPVPARFQLNMLRSFEEEGVALLVTLRRTEAHWLATHVVAVGFSNALYPAVSEPLSTYFDYPLPTRFAELRSAFSEAMSSGCRLDSFRDDEAFGFLYYKKGDNCD